MDIKTAVNTAVDACIREGILAEFLTEQRAEGRAETLLEIYHTLINKGYSQEEALAIVPLSKDQINSNRD